MNVRKLFGTFFINFWFLRTALEVLHPNNFQTIISRKNILKGPKQVLKSR